ncbi:MAG: conserved membrane protein of unknown function [Promethearchaeota archaeon]|nr:MAG: conserved membrane protein of unknown function [Candidatus Lokiarchaeota archaeon]
MVLYQIDFGRILQVFVVQGIIAIFFIYLIFQILKRNRKKINVLFALSYVFVLIGLVNNMIYAFIRDSDVLVAMNFITNFSITFALIFLMIFNLILLYSEKKITTPKQTIIILLYGGILFLQILFLPYNGIIVNEETNWRSLWSLPYYLYIILVISVGAVIPTIYLSVRIYFDMEDEALQKRWLYFIIGAIGLFIYMYGIFTTDLFVNQLFRLIWTLISLSIVIWVYLMYYGVGRELES